MLEGCSLAGLGVRVRQSGEHRKDSECQSLQAPGPQSPPRRPEPCISREPALQTLRLGGSFESSPHEATEAQNG